MPEDTAIEKKTPVTLYVEMQLEMKDGGKRTAYWKTDVMGELIKGGYTEAMRFAFERWLEQEGIK